MEKIINRLIGDAVKGVDVYHYKESMWLIFTDKKEWVIELEKDKSLWYNYAFFNNLFKYVSLDVVEHQHYITKWVEGILQNGVMSTDVISWDNMLLVEDAIKNGVRHTQGNVTRGGEPVEAAIQNGVMSTMNVSGDCARLVKDTIQNGVVSTTNIDFYGEIFVDGIIQNGVMRTDGLGHRYNGVVETTIQNGVKNIDSPPTGLWSFFGEGVIQNGVMRTKTHNYNIDDYIDNTINDGIKIT